MKELDRFRQFLNEADYGQEAYFEKLFKDFEETKKALIDVARVQLASAAYGYNFDPSQVGGFAKDERKVQKYLRADFRDVKSNMDSYISKNYLKDKYWEDDPNALFGYLRDNMDYTIDNLKQEVKFIIKRNGEGLNDPKQKEKYKFELLAIETIKKTISVLEKFKSTIAKDPRTTGNAVDKRGSRDISNMSLQEGTSQNFYEVDFIEMDGNEVTRDFRHFTDENEAKQMFNDLKSNPEIVKVTRSELFKGDGKNYLGGSEEREYAVNKVKDLHRIFLNSRLGDKRFEEPEPIMQFFGRKNQAREEFMSLPELNEGSYRVEYTTLDGEKAKSSIYNSKEEADKKEAKLVNSGIRKAKVVEVPKQINEFDDKSMKDYGDAMKVALGSKKIGSPEDRAQKRFDRLSKDDQTKLMKLKAMMGRERDMEESNLKGIREEDDEKGIREETSIEENMPKAVIMRQIRDAEEILDSGEADGMPLDNETEMLVRQELKRLKQMVGAKGMREEISLEEIYKDIMEVDKEEEKIRKEYDRMKRPSQDEVHDAFEKFNRETHYLNNKPVSKWDAADMSNWKVILRKGGKIN